MQRRNYQNEIVLHDPSFVMFIDEMSTTGEKFRRRRGRFRKGEPAVLIRRLGYPDETGNSLIAACNINCVLLKCTVLTSENLTREDHH